MIKLKTNLKNPKKQKRSLQNDYLYKSLENIPKKLILKITTRKLTFYGIFLGVYLGSSAILASAMSVAVTLSVSFLSAERILIILRSRLHTRYNSYFVRLAFTACTLIALFICVFSFWTEWPLNETTSKSFFCIVFNEFF